MMRSKHFRKLGQMPANSETRRLKSVSTSMNRESILIDLKIHGNYTSDKEMWRTEVRHFGAERFGNDYNTFQIRGTVSAVAKL